MSAGNLFLTSFQQRSNSKLVFRKSCVQGGLWGLTRWEKVGGKRKNTIAILYIFRRPWASEQLMKQTKTHMSSYSSTVTFLNVKSPLFWQRCYSMLQSKTNNMTFQQFRCDSPLFCLWVIVSFWKSTLDDNMEKASVSTKKPSTCFCGLHRYPC